MWGPWSEDCHGLQVGQPVVGRGRHMETAGVDSAGQRNKRVMRLWGRGDSVYVFIYRLGEA